MDMTTLEQRLQQVARSLNSSASRAAQGTSGSGSLPQGMIPNPGQPQPGQFPQQGLGNGSMGGPGPMPGLGSGFIPTQATSFPQDERATSSPALPAVDGGVNGMIPSTSGFGDPAQGGGAGMFRSSSAQQRDAFGMQGLGVSKSPGRCKLAATLWITAIYAH